MLPPSASREILPRAQVIAAAVLFSTGGAAIKATSLDAWQVASFRSGVAALVLALALPTWRRGIERRTWPVASAYAATMLLFVLANKLTTAANTIFLQATAPIYLLLIGPRLLGERVRSRDLLSTAAVAAGMLLILAGGQAASITAPKPVEGNTLAAANGLTWALTLAGLRRLGREQVAGLPNLLRDHTGAAVLAGNLLTFLIALPMAVRGLPATATDAAVVAYLGACQIGLAYVLLTRGLRHVQALEAALLLLIEPVASTAWAWLLHAEQPSTPALAGCSVILVATAIRARTSPA